MKRILITVLVFLAFSFNAKALEYDFYDTCSTGQLLYYRILSSNSVAVVAGEKCNQYQLSGNMEIPSEVEYEGTSYSVIQIGQDAFESCTGLTSVIIPASVTSIGNYAFYRCSGLTFATIPNSVTSIGFGAFYACTGLTSVTIPSSVSYIGVMAFSRCSGLLSIVVETGNAVYDSRDNCNAIVRTADNVLLAGCQTTVIPNSILSIGNDAFFCCSELTSVIIPNSVTSIGFEAFAGCTGLTFVTIPSSVTSIEGCAFYGCTGLTSVTIPSSVSYIGNMAFSSCSGLLSIVVETGNAVYDSRDNCNAIIRTADNVLLTGCKTTVIPNSVTHIDIEAFCVCSTLTSVTIPSSVASIGQSAFYGCTGLTSVTIPNSVTWIGPEAFSGCTGLTTMTIPSSVETILCSVFSNCSGLTSIVVEADNNVYDSRDNCNAIIKTTDNTLIVGCRATIIPNTVTSIGPYAFNGCTGLTSVTIPSSVTSIAVTSISAAFHGCTGLTSIVVEQGNPNYDSRDNCNAIIRTEDNTLIQGCKTTIIPNTVTSIGDYAFYGCTGLTSVTIPNSATSIGNYAFYGCTGLTSVTIPNSVTFIGDDAFDGCSGLTSLTFGSTTPPLFSGSVCDIFPVLNDLIVYVPYGSAENYEEIFGNLATVNIVEITVGLDDHNGFDFKVYPNPTNGVVNVQFTNHQSQITEIQLVDAFGRLLRSSNVVGANNYSPLRTDAHGSAVQTQIDLSRYATGVYFIKAVADGKTVAVRKVVRN